MIPDTPQPVRPEARAHFGTLSLTEAELLLSLADQHLATLANWLEAAVLAGDSDRATKLARERVNGDFYHYWPLDPISDFDALCSALFGGDMPTAGIVEYYIGGTDEAPTFSFKGDREGCIAVMYHLRDKGVIPTMSRGWKTPIGTVHTNHRAA